MQICSKLTTWWDERFARGGAHLPDWRSGRRGDCYLFTETWVCFFFWREAECDGSRAPCWEHSQHPQGGDWRGWCEDVTCTTFTVSFVKAKNEVALQLQLTQGPKQMHQSRADLTCGQWLLIGERWLKFKVTHKGQWYTNTRIKRENRNVSFLGWLFPTNSTSSERINDISLIQAYVTFCIHVPIMTLSSWLLWIGWIRTAVTASNSNNNNNLNEDLRTVL